MGFFFSTFRQKIIVYGKEDQIQSLKEAGGDPACYHDDEQMRVPDAGESQCIRVLWGFAYCCLILGKSPRVSGAPSLLVRNGVRAGVLLHLKPVARSVLNRLATSNPISGDAHQPAVFTNATSSSSVRLRYNKKAVKSRSSLRKSWDSLELIILSVVSSSKNLTFELGMASAWHSPGTVPGNPWTWWEENSLKEPGWRCLDAALLDTQSSDSLEHFRSIADLEHGHSMKLAELITHQISLLLRKLSCPGIE